jgi:hypothetical protein
MTDCSTTEEAAGRIASVVMVLEGLSSAIEDCGARPGLPAGLSDSIDILQAGARFAAARGRSAARAGPCQLRQIEKTVLVELSRGVLIAAEAIRETGEHAWPLLESGLKEARAALRDAVAFDPELFSPIGMDAAGVAAGGAAPFATAGWRTLSGGRYAAVGEDGVVLAAFPMPDEAGAPAWLAQVGGVGVAICNAPGEAAAAAASAHAAVFGAAEIPGHPEAAAAPEPSVCLAAAGAILPGNRIPRTGQAKWHRRAKRLEARRRRGGAG